MIGLIFGETDFPKYIYKKIKKKEKYTIIDLTNKNFFTKDKNPVTQGKASAGASIPGGSPR